MASTKTGRIYKITPVQEITGRSGKAFAKRTLVLDATRYDSHTGERKFDNYPSFEFTGDGMKVLDGFKEGDCVTVSYDINGREYTDPDTHEARYFNTLRGYRVEPYGKRQERPGAQGSDAPQPPAGQEGNTDLPF